MKPLLLLRIAFSAAVFCLFRAELAAQTVSAPSDAAAPTAESLLQKAAAAYTAAQSYSDVNSVTYRNKDGSERLSVEFRIWFARPSNFRVDAVSKNASGGVPRREVMWTEGAAARTWATDKPVSARAKVQIAGSKMFGTYAYHIPTLLDASYGGPRRLHELSKPILGEDETFEGVACHRIKGDWLGDAYEVWVGKDDSLVRKIVAQYSDHQLEEIHREIAVDQPMALGVFRFAPENEKPASPAPKGKK